ncbi:hypothetical protein E0500_042070 [Streptomyces sp. KM273126]|uniref:hypothetical protein n=1 Tax=Streptomyces sp. KM273126 TaxID=2545247 RepID=UPI001404301A|nr:hypothetical protein [Streptomyces sp. KM273126]MBA2813729.1 hypothetical protein [Streptomyces sp. KM273126]
MPPANTACGRDGGKLEADGYAARDVERLLVAAEELHQRFNAELNPGATADPEPTL